ncbi:SDR family oxidoreductase [Leptospira idonii]|uniref:SDR family oxidoreductase n=1 Tax=Leptospira idonii TaxID=1193500 RepID=A0A4R9M1A6_9LEPT|nr:SDR family oxidoreductase [Leptospira idonii]TGN19741.1 SDR family oxidoreductase [Leptospira idonii]
MEWKDKVVWVTGASSGMGEEMVKELAGKGAKVILSSRNREELSRVQKEAGLSDQNSLILPLDLEKYETLSKSVPAALKKWGKVDALINNGGISQRDLAENTSLSVTEKIMNVNFYGAIALTMALYPHFKENRSGIIAVISSVAGKTGTRLRSSYSASKHALHGYFDSLRAESHAFGIQVSLICPGFVRTKISYNALVGSGKTHNKMDDALAKGLDPNQTAKRILDSIARGKDEVVIGGFQETMATYLKRFFPGLLTKILRNAKVT